ncbi:hypothetical protein D3C81_1739920 [compost metagenome]
MHILFPRFPHTKTILDYNIPQIVDSALHFIEPSGGTRQRIGCTNVEHQKTVDITDTGLTVDIGSQQQSMLWLAATVAADIEVPALFCGNDTKVLALRLGTLTDTAAHR